MRVNEEDEVLVDDLPIKPKNKFVTLAYYKPAGITCTSEPDVKGNIIDAVNYPERIFPIGRLDKESEGLILLTNDGSIVNQILRSENEHEKEYLVYVHKPIDREFKYLMEEGVEILNKGQYRILSDEEYNDLMKQL